jgi:hypothetical protein
MDQANEDDEFGLESSINISHHIHVSFFIFPDHAHFWQESGPYQPHCKTRTKIQMHRPLKLTLSMGLPRAAPR